MGRGSARQPRASRPGLNYVAPSELEFANELLTQDTASTRNQKRDSTGANIIKHHSESIVHNSEFTRLHRISSPTNSLIKVFRRALKDGVTPEGWLALEGPVVFEELLRRENVPSTHALLRSTSRIRSVLVSEEAAAKYEHIVETLASDIELAQAPEHIFRGVAQTVNPQGLAALVEVTPPEMTAVLAQRDVLAVVACGLQEPGNLGTIARTAEAFGAGALLALKSTVGAFNPKAVRASGGAVFRLPIYTGLEPSQTFERLARAGIRLAAAEPRGETQLPVADLHGSLAILVGNEAAGLDPGIACRASLRLRIPIRPEVDSINAATSAGILLYEVARQRGFQY